MKAEGMTLSDLIEICRAWTHLGWAIDSQLDSVIDGGEIADQNPHAMRIALDTFLAVVIDKTSDTDSVHEEAYDLAAHIEQYLDELGTTR